jgi:hypothetical protein
MSDLTKINSTHLSRLAYVYLGEITVEQARSIAQDWLADIRKGEGLLCDD